MDRLVNEKSLFEDLHNSCAKRCCFKIPTFYLMKIRQDYYSLSEIGRLKFIVNYLEMNVLESNTVKNNLPFRFHIDGTDVCKKCWCTIYHISRKKFNHAYECVLTKFVEPHRNSSSFAIQV